MLAAIAMMVIVMSLTVQMLTASAAAMRRAQQHLQATEAAANLMEHLTVVPFDELDQNALKRPELVRLTEELEPVWTSRLNVVEDHAVAPAKRLELTLQAGSASGRVRVVRLVAWRFAEGARIP
jgi:hypothetical protein